ncbi:PDZ domain-containing protein [Cognaticolwellia mytili]|uniref:PDZ domain-containing protein n=1 Tax=Cognaticolwellia mytili TaxID=1888913 RepID=UPI000A175B4C|nr:PDZ domain-containing protein [Cognaticolwellia mytili]
MKIKYLSILLLALPLTAGELKSPQAQRIAEQMSKMITQKIQEITVLEQAAGAKNVQIDLSQPQRFNSGRFGIILSANSPGLVISVTPNSQAHNFGIQSGDKITSINGAEIIDNIKPALAVLQYAKKETGVEITIMRDGKSMMLAGTLTVKLTPGWKFSTINQDIPQPLMSVTNKIEPEKQECGQVKLGFRVEESGYKVRSLKTVVVVEAIDGVKVENPLEQDYLKIPVGYHRLTVHRKIHHFDKEHAESAEFNVRIDANRSYFLAYRSDTLFSSNKSKKYAELPVIWKEKQQNCEMQ